MVKGGRRLAQHGAHHGLAAVLGLGLTPFVDFPEPASWIFLPGSIVTHLGYYLFLLLLAYRHGEFSQVHPIARVRRSAGGRFAWLLPPNETLTTLQMLGIAQISGGILSLAVDKPLTGVHKWEPVIFGLLTGLTIMGYTLCDGQGCAPRRRDGVATTRLYRLAFVLDGPLLIAYCFGGGAAAIKFGLENWKLGLAGGALSGSALRDRHLCDARGPLRPRVGLARNQRDLRGDHERLSIEREVSPATLCVGKHGRAGAVLLH